MQILPLKYSGSFLWFLLCRMHLLNEEIKIMTLALLLSIGRDGQIHTSIYDKRDYFNFYITTFPFLSSKIHLRRPMACLSLSLYDTPGLLISMFCCEGKATLQNDTKTGISRRTLYKIVIRKLYCRYIDRLQQYEVSLSRMLFDILNFDQLQ